MSIARLVGAPTPTNYLVGGYYIYIYIYIYMAYLLQYAYQGIGAKGGLGMGSRGPPPPILRVGNLFLRVREGFGTCFFCLCSAWILFPHNILILLFVLLSLSLRAPAGIVTTRNLC